MSEEKVLTEEIAKDFMLNDSSTPPQSSSDLNHYSYIDDSAAEILGNQGYRFVSPEQLNRLDAQQVVAEEKEL